MVTPDELMRQHGGGGHCELCDLPRCPTYQRARIEHVTEPARTFDAAVRESYGPPWTGAGSNRIGLSDGQKVAAFYAILDDQTAVPNRAL